MPEIKVLTVQSGQAEDIGDPTATDPMERLWTSAIYRKQINGPVWVSKEGLPDDEHVYEGHGGPEKAVLASAVEHYTHWQESLGLAQMPHGGFGENLTTQGLLENEACIGDIYRVSDGLIIQITQARPPCWKLSRRFRRFELSRLMEESGRTSIFLRVLEEGYVQAGDTITLLERPNPDWTVARAYSIYCSVATHLEEAHQLAVLPAFSEQMRPDLEEFLARGSSPDFTGRLVGPNL
jgi:MOSC domain-containing protein YiiM